MTAPTRDPGVQPERTRLAWRRTTLAFVIVVLLAWRNPAYGGGSALAYLAAAAVTLLWLAFLLVAHRRIVALAGHQPPGPRSGTVRGTAALVVAVAAVAVLLLW